MSYHGSFRQNLETIIYAQLIKHQDAYQQGCYFKPENNTDIILEITTTTNIGL